MLAFILIVGVLIAIYFIVNSQKKKKRGRTAPIRK